VVVAWRICQRYSLSWRFGSFNPGWRSFDIDLSIMAEMRILTTIFLLNLTNFGVLSLNK